MTSILPNITLETGKEPKHSIIWLHGLGADGEDFVPIAEEMNSPRRGTLHLPARAHASCDHQWRLCDACLV